MFASRIVNGVIVAALKASPGVTAVVGNRIYRGANYPQGTQLPAILFYMEQSEYDMNGVPTRAEHITGATMRFIVRVEDAATSDTRIAPAAEAQFHALSGLITNTSDNHQVSFVALGEAPLPTYNEGETVYQRLGTRYSVTVTRGG